MPGHYCCGDFVSFLALQLLQACLIYGLVDGNILTGSLVRPVQIYLINC